jgi:CheY-like chemotaxis protein
MADRHALVVQDQELLRDLLAHSLEKLGFSVHSVRTPEEAAAALAETDPDVLVMDARVPNFDAVAWLAGQRSAAPAVPFVVLTGLGSRLGVLPHTLAPCAAVVLPLDGDAFAAAVERCLREADSLGGASVAFGFDLEVPEAGGSLPRVLAHVRTLQRLGGALATPNARAYAHTLRCALDAAREHGAVRVRCSFGTSRMSCEVGVLAGAGPWSLEDARWQLLRDRLDSFELSPDGKRLTFAVSRHLAAAA